MSRRLARLAPPALALVMALAAHAHAAEIAELGAGGTSEDRPFGSHLTGFHLGQDFAANSWGSVVVRLDVAYRGIENLTSLTVGPRLGSTRGRVRPYFDACFGFSTGTLEGAGFVAGYGVGARVPIAEHVGAFVYVRSLGTANMEYSSHVAEWRLGLTLTRATAAGTTR